MPLKFKMLYIVCSRHSHKDSGILFRLPSVSNSCRAFGDKTSPPDIPFTNSSAQVETEECEEGMKAEGQVSDGQDSPEPNAVDTSCQGMQELRLADKDLEALKDKEPVEDGEGEDKDDNDSRSPQGEILTPRGFTVSRLSHMLTFMTVFTEQTDALLLQCFLHALKAKVKKSELPLLTSTFLRNHMASCW